MEQVTEPFSPTVLPIVDLLESADVTVLIGNCHRFESLSLSAFA